MIQLRPSRLSCKRFEVWNPLLCATIWQRFGNYQIEIFAACIGFHLNYFPSQMWHEIQGSAVHQVMRNGDGNLINVDLLVPLSLNGGVPLCRELDNYYRLILSDKLS